MFYKLVAIWSAHNEGLFQQEMYQLRKLIGPLILPCNGGVAVNKTVLMQDSTCFDVDGVATHAICVQYESGVPLDSLFSLLLWNFGGNIVDYIYVAAPNGFIQAGIQLKSLVFLDSALPDNGKVVFYFDTKKHGSIIIEPSFLMRISAKHCQLDLNVAVIHRESDDSYDVISVCLNSEGTYVYSAFDGDTLSPIPAVGSDGVNIMDRIGRFGYLFMYHIKPLSGGPDRGRS